jgi:hypothetical protein
MTEGPIMRYTRFFPRVAAVVAASLLFAVRGFAPQPPGTGGWWGSGPPPIPSDVINQIQSVIASISAHTVVMGQPQFSSQGHGQTNVAFSLYGPPGQTVRILRSTNLSDWN